MLSLIGTQCPRSQKKMVTNSFGNKNFRQPMRGLRTHSRVPIFLALFGFWGVGLLRERNFCFFHVPNLFPRRSHQVPQNVLNCTSILPKNFGHSSTFIYMQIVKGGQRADSIGDYPMLLWYMEQGATRACSRANLCFPLVDSHYKVELVQNKWNRR